jgi:putative selenate reductase
MSDRFRPLDAERLTDWIADELDHSGSIFGIPRELFFVPSADDRFKLDLRSARLDTPIGVAAGPHTQLAQNIVVSWLCGARVIELKTVQILDEIEVAKPCIDMQDAGYNIEWSQELKIDESFAEYLLAWVMIHALHRHLGLPGERPGVLFDLSVGYDLDGIRQPPMRRYLERMADAGEALEKCIDAVGRRFPEVRDVEVPAQIADSATLSTLHGCPPQEIGAIAEHLLGDRKLHTAVKLNPTLLGYDTVLDLLQRDLGWSDVEPHAPSFDADIGYDDACELLSRMSDFGAHHGREFGIKLCNTLPVINRRADFDANESSAYLSGRPLHALAVTLANRLAGDSDGRLGISFAGGADAFNTSKLLAGGLRPVTTCSDLLRPGGYLRLRQYLTEIEAAMDRAGAADLDDLAMRCAPTSGSVREAAYENLARYARSLRSDPTLQRATYRRDHTKTSRKLGLFDCVRAPCTDACGVDQQVPEYMRRVAAGEVAAAAEVISTDNPLPSILGRACHHPCEPVCLRTHLDQPLAIREIKRFVTDHARPPTTEARPGGTGLRVAIVGGGPCGLAAAVHLARHGARATVFEARDEGGGMVSATIPGYRASPIAIRRDLAAVEALGAEMVYSTVVGTDVGLDELFERGFSDVVVSIGAQKGLRLGLENEDATGVYDGLDFLRGVRRGEVEDLGPRVAVIGGGDVAMDCARSARRLTGGEVEILYRRTVDEMPAHPEEVRDFLAEGITIRELVAPRRIETANGRICALECVEMVLGEADDSGRPRPVEKRGSGITLELSALIVAIGQRVDLSVFGERRVKTSSSGYVEVDGTTMETSRAHVYAGGDLVAPGPSNIVDACGDGRRIAGVILDRAGLSTTGTTATIPTIHDRADLLRRRSRRLSRVHVPRRSESDRGGFVEVIDTLTPEAAVREASRCLDCDELCSTCDGVCPNRAIVTYEQPPRGADLPTLRNGRDGGMEVADGTIDWQVSQRPQVAVVADFCNECGNCVAFCPTSGRPWSDKPRLYFDRREFEAESDNAFMLLHIDGGIAIQGRFGGRLHQLEVAEDLIYDHPAYRARLNQDSFKILELSPRPWENGTQDLSLEPCAVMLTLLRGLTGSMPHLPFSEAEDGWLVEAER